MNTLLYIMASNFRGARADEGQAVPTEPVGQASGSTPAEPTTSNAPTVNFEQLISKARQEEKEKLYPEIQKLKTQNEDKVGRINELLLSIGEKDETIKNLQGEIAELKKDSNKSVSEEVRAKDLKIIELQNLIEAKDNEVASIKLEAYKAQKLAEAGADVIPEMVTGTTPEEIDLSIESSKAMFARIASQVKGSVVVTQKTSNEIPMPNPNVASFNNQVSQLDLGQIDMFSKEGKAQYAQMRQQLGLK